MMSTEQQLLLATRIAQSRMTEKHLKEEVAALEAIGLYREAKAKAMLRVTHIKRILRYQNRLTQHQA